MTLQIIAYTLLTLGTFFLLVGSLGIIRLPDFYARTHAMSKPDTMGLILTMSGAICLHGWNINSLKLLLVVVFVAIANPAATHALARAARKTGLKAWTRQTKD